MYAISGMQVMESFEEPIIFEYCRYGRNYRKKTMLLATHNIRYDERDNPLGFCPLLCMWFDHCNAMVAPRKHYPDDDVAL